MVRPQVRLVRDGFGARSRVTCFDCFEGTVPEGRRDIAGCWSSWRCGAAVAGACDADGRRKATRGSRRDLRAAPVLLTGRERCGMAARCVRNF
eukprot:1198975-Prymnesium_polylepis.1